MRKTLQLVIVIAFSSLCASGCATTGASAPASSRPAASAEATKAPGFGPVYSLESTTDPIVAATAKAMDSTSTPYVSGEIRGYLVDWVVGNKAGQAIWEMAVLKDGSVWVIGERPAAFWGAKPPSREQPESLVESGARQSSVAVAHEWVKRHRPMYGQARPAVYNYLVRLRRSDETTADVWVDPVVDKGSLFTEVTLSRPLP